MLPETEKKVDKLAHEVKNLMLISHRISVTHARIAAGKKAKTVERLAEVLWHETLDLRREVNLLRQLERTTPDTKGVHDH